MDKQPDQGVSACTIRSGSLQAQAYKLGLQHLQSIAIYLSIVHPKHKYTSVQTCFTVWTLGKISYSVTCTKLNVKSKSNISRKNAKIITSGFYCGKKMNLIAQRNFLQINKKEFLQFKLQIVRNIVTKLKRAFPICSKANALEMD